MNKLWLGLDLGAAVAARILHVNDKGQVEFEPHFPEVRPWSAPPLQAGGLGPLPKPLRAPCRAPCSAGRGVRR